VSAERLARRGRIEVVFLFALAALLAQAAGGSPALAEESARAAAVEDSPQRARARALLDEDDDDDGYGVTASSGLGSLFSRRSGLLGTGLMAAAFYFLFMRGGRAQGQGNGGWGSYYLFWIVAPALVAIVSSHPSALGLVVVGLVARRWLPDPYLILKHRARVRRLRVEVSTNPGNVTARRDLAEIWLEKRRPQHALPLVEQALERDPGSPELLYLRGVSELGLKRPARALDAFLAVVHQSPTFRYGEAYLRAADALILLGRHEDAEEALGHYLKVNSSSLEALFKLARVRRARKDDAGAARAKAELEDVWHLLHGFQRRRQLGWYVRAKLGR
jgi:tetratricopeptide (TPR) repeat protein